MKGTWHCHDCEFSCESISKARQHSKESGPVYRRSTLMRHVLTRNAGNAILDRVREPDEREYE